MKIVNTTALWTAVLCGMMSAFAVEPEYYAEEKFTPTRDDHYEQLAYSYYPYLNGLEVAFDLAAFKKKASLTRSQANRRHVIIKVVRKGTHSVAAKGKLPLNKKGRASGLVKVPDLKDGTYNVVYECAGKSFISPVPLVRKHFPWERNKLGKTHKVYPPFKPVKVKGRTVTVVGRTYTMNAFGCFDKVVTRGRDVLAKPMTITVNGRDPWQKKKAGGKALHPDTAVFTGQATGQGLTIKSRAIIEEDGCARITLTYGPVRRPVSVKEMVLEIAYKDREVPLFHYVAHNGMRQHYAGRTPRGSRIKWYHKGCYWCPSVCFFSGPDKDGPIWDSSSAKHWPKMTMFKRGPSLHNLYQAADRQFFVPYIWLGAEERGLCWFGENTRGYVLKKGAPVQVLRREGKSVVLRVFLVNKPVRLTKARTVVFGLQASPTKPMDSDWRTRPFNSGAGPVSCWGGYNCGSKYPDNRNFTIVDKIQEARKTGKADKAWLDNYWKQKDDKRPLHYKKSGRSWLSLQQHFLSWAAYRQEMKGTYFEGHLNDRKMPDLHIFIDEWGNLPFNRFQKRWSDGASLPESYRDFCLYYANEWMKRGVGLYFDNTNVKFSFHPRLASCYRDEEGNRYFTHIFWDQRAYYRRMFKLMAWWNQNRSKQKYSYPIDLLFHITSTQILPFNTWSTGLLCMEQRYWGGGKRQEKGNPFGKRVPWPADYIRAMYLGRKVGSISIMLDCLNNGSHRKTKNKSPIWHRANWAMGKIHEVRGNATWWVFSHKKSKQYAMLKPYAEAWKEFRREKEDKRQPRKDLKIYNYWSETSPLTVRQKPTRWGMNQKDERWDVKWIALTRKKNPRGLVLLQNYSDKPRTVTVTFKGMRYMKDIVRRKTYGAGENITVPGDYGTILLLADRSRLRL